METKYFIVSYIYGNGGIGSGNVGIKTSIYPNVYDIKEASKEQSATPISIIEVSKIQYECFWKSK